MNQHLKGIDTIIVRVADIARSQSWYAEKLGFSVTFQDEQLRLAVLDTGGPVSITLWQTDAPLDVQSESCAYPIFRTAEAAAAHVALSTAGIRVDDLVTDHLTTYFRFYDEDGNVMEACQVH